MNCVASGSLPLHRTPLNPLLPKQSIKSLSTFSTPRPYEKPRTLLHRSFPDLAHKKRSLLARPLRAQSADADGPSPSSPTPAASSTAASSSQSTSPEDPKLSSSSSSTEQPQPKRSKSSPPRRSNESWLSKLASQLKPGTSVRFILNILAFMLFLRIFPMPGVSNSPLSQPDGVVLRISFSEFVKSVRRNEIARVVVDGNHLSYALQPTAQMFSKGALKDVAFDQRKITFETTRPTDWPTPYEAMLANGVQISAIEKKGGLFGTLLVRKKKEKENI